MSDQPTVPLYEITVESLATWAAADQPKNHRRIIATVAAIGATKASASRITVSM